MMTKRYEKVFQETSIRMQVQFPGSPLRRILILGPSGSGKSTVCKRISRILGIPAVHLDIHYWKPNWVETPKEEWHDKVREMIASEKWVMDGEVYSNIPDTCCCSGRYHFLRNIP